ncbi:MAG: glycosyltransferase [Deltaproteobacteria bacterium]
MENARPSFSIIIPTYERFKELDACLDSITNIEYPEDKFEVIVVDDGSTNSPEDVVKAYQTRIDVKLIIQEHAGPAAARNRGAREATGKFLAFTDDDCKPSRDWLGKLADRFTQDEDCLVAGRTANALPDNPYSTASQLIVDYLHAYNNNKGSRFLTSNNMALSRERFWEAGGFDTSFPLAAGEDREFCDRCLYNGFRTVYDPDVIVNHAHPLTFGKFLRQHFNYGIGAFNFHEIRARRSRQKMRIEPFSFYVNLILYPRKARNKQKLKLSVLMFLSQVANAWGYFRKRSAELIRNKQDNRKGSRLH